MKGRAILWAAALIASHAAAYFAMGGRGSQGAASSAAAGSVRSAPSARSRDRAERQGSHEKLLRELLASDLPSEDFKAARETLLIDWIKRDLRGALDLFFLPGSPALYKKLAGDSDKIEAELHKEMARQPSAVWHWIRDGRYGSNRLLVTRLWNSALILDGQRDLVLAALAECGPAEQFDSIEKLCNRGSAAELERIREIFGGSLRNHDEVEELIELYAARRVSLAEGDEAQIFAHEEDLEIRSELCSKWAERELQGLAPEQIVERLTGLPAELLLDALDFVCGQSPQGKVAGVAAIVDAMERAGLWAHLDSETARNEVGRLVGNSYRDYMETDEVFAQLNGISNADLRSAALQRLGGELSDVGVDAEVLLALATLPEGAGRDELLGGFLEDIDAVAPEWDAALALIGDVGMRADLEERWTRGIGDERREILRQVDAAWEHSINGPANEHEQAVAAVRRGLYLGDGLGNLGKYDEAIARFEEVLRIDRYNQAALSGIEAARRAAADMDAAKQDNYQWRR